MIETVLNDEWPGIGKRKAEYRELYRALDQFGISRSKRISLGSVPGAIAQKKAHWYFMHRGQEIDTAVSDGWLYIRRVK